MAQAQVHPARNITLRHLQSGDLGMIQHRHGVLYAQEFGWGLLFEAYVGDTLSQFAKNYNPERERVWIAEQNGNFMGSIALVQSSAETAQLRWLLVEPQARGLGVGKKLVEAVLEFARACQYKRIVLSTETSCVSARNIYRQYGFQLTESKTSALWGCPINEEQWELSLASQ